MVTQPILEQKKDFKRPVIWGSFNVIWGSILFPGGPCGDLENGVKFLTEENYQNTIEMLKTQFGNEQKIISAHMQALLKLQDCPRRIFAKHVVKSLNCSGL